MKVAMNIFHACYSLFAFTALFGTSLAFGTRSFVRHNSPKGGNFVKFASTTEQVDLSVPYDAAAQLAYEAAESSDDFQTFKAKYNEEAVKLVMSKRNLSSGGEEAKREGTSAEKEEIKPKNPVVAKLQRILRSKQRAYQNYLINRSIEMKLKPIYERKGKIDTYTPQPIHDAETERLLKEVWEAKSEVRVVEAQSENIEADSLKQENESLQEEYKKLSEVLKTSQKQADSLKQENESRQEENKKLSEALQTSQKQADNLNQENESLQQENKKLSEELETTQKQFSAQLSEKEQEISTLSTGIDSLAIQLQDEQMESARKTNDMKSLENKLKVLKDIEADLARLITQLQEQRRDIASRDAAIASLESRLGETEAALRVLEKERSSFRLLARQAWRTVSSRISKRAVRVKNFVVRKDNNEPISQDDTNGVDKEAEKIPVALRKK